MGEFWAREQFGLSFKHPTFLQKWKCRLTGGHIWHKYTISEDGRYERCDKCWRFRDDPDATMTFTVDSDRVQKN